MNQSQYSKQNPVLGQRSGTNSLQKMPQNAPGGSSRTLNSRTNMY